MNYYSRYYKKLLKGDPAKPRGMETVQLMNVHHTFFPGTIVRRRKDNIAIGLTELLQFIAGDFDLGGFAVAAPNARLDLFGAQSAYGPRTKNQFHRIIQELKNDPESRRAVVVLAGQDEAPEELPCTLSIQFQTSLVDTYIRLLTATFTMRSSDAMWGLPYDIIQFGGVVLAVASVLQMPAAMCTVSIANAHVYKATQMKVPGFDDTWMFEMPSFPTWGYYQSWARDHMRMRLSKGDLIDLFKVRKVGVP